MKTVLITGCNGFVGPHCAAEFVAHGYTVAGLDRGEKNKNSLSQYFSVDITDPEKVKAAVVACYPNYIVHLAGISAPAFAEEHRDTTFAVNCEGTKNILDAALALPEKPRVLIVSSSHVYGAPEYLPIDESHPLQGTGAYAASRVEQEKIVSSYFSKLPIIIARSFNHTGPGQTTDFITSKIVEQIVEIKKGLRREIWIGNRELKRDIGDVRDVVRAYRLLLEVPAVGLTVNVCRGQSVSLKEMIDYVKLLAGLEAIHVSVNPAFVKKDDPIDIYGSNKKLASLTVWHPEHDIKDTLGSLYEYWNSVVI